MAENHTRIAQHVKIADNLNTTPVTRVTTLTYRSKRELNSDLVWIRKYWVCSNAASILRSKAAFFHTVDP